MVRVPVQLVIVKGHNEDLNPFSRDNQRCSKVRQIFNHSEGYLLLHPKRLFCKGKTFPRVPNWPGIEDKGRGEENVGMSRIVVNCRKDYSFLRSEHAAVLVHAQRCCTSIRKHGHGWASELLMAKFADERLISCFSCHTSTLAADLSQSVSSTWRRFLWMLLLCSHIGMSSTTRRFRHRVHLGSVHPRACMSVWPLRHGIATTARWVHHRYRRTCDLAWARTVRQTNKRDRRSAGNKGRFGNHPLGNRLLATSDRSRSKLYRGRATCNRQLRKRPRWRRQSRLYCRRWARKSW